MTSEILDQLESWSDLEDKIVMVTGASSGLGLEICLDLAKVGCKIVATARRINRLDSLCEQINQMSSPIGDPNGDFRRGVAVKLDVTSDSKAIEASVQKAWDAFGHIDALVNNAGVSGQVISSLDLSDEEWNRVVKTNLTGAQLVSKYIGTHMRAVDRGGSIINISSISGLNRVQTPGTIVYSSSKAALNSMAKIMAIELGEFNIRVNGIAPGIFKSEITEQLLEKKWVKNVAKRIVPLETIVKSEPALTSLVRYLIHPSSTYVSGNIFVVDAGATLPGFPIFSSL